MALKYSNNASTTVATTVSSGTTLTVASTATFPTLASGDWTYITVNGDVLKVTATTSTTFTLDTAISATYTEDDDVELRISKELLDDLSDQNDNYASWTISDGSNGEAISSAELATFVGGTNTTTTWNSTNNTLTITSDDTTYTSSDFNHDDLTGFVANEHIDWTVDQGNGSIYSGNYINTTYSVGDGGLTQKNFTTTLKDKLDGIQAGAKDDQTGAEIKTAYEGEADTNAYTDNEKSKLSGIESNAKDDQVSSDFTHNDLQGVDTDEHLDWTIAQSGKVIHATNYTDTTYSVGDGGLTQVNFTTADNTKLDGIEESADVTDTANVVASLTAGTNVTIATDGTISSTDTDTNTDTKWDGGSSTLNATTGRASLGLGNSATKDTGTTSGTVCTGDDGRLSDARTPTSHSHTVADLPAIAMTTVQTASTESAHLSLTAQEGDVVIRSDENKTYIHNGGTAGTMADYTVLATPTDAVTSVNGNTGAVSLTIPTNNNELTNGAGYITSYTDTNTVDMGDGFKVADSGGTDKFIITENEKLRIAGTGGTTISFNASTQTVTIDSTDNDTVYNHGTDHPTTAGNKHIPTGGSTGKFLKWSASGTAVWADDNDTVYSHPTHAGDDINIDTAPLSGATVISDLDFNVTTDTQGHVTDANGTVSTRDITLLDLGYTGDTDANNYSHPNTHSGDDIDIDTGALTGATVISDLDISMTSDTRGHIGNASGTVATRVLTLADLSHSSGNHIPTNGATGQILKYASSGTAQWSDIGNAVENSVEYTLTSSTDTFAVTYTAPYLQVFLNGTRLDAGDYTATNGTSVVLDATAVSGDVVFILAFDTFALADHYSKTASDGRYLQPTGDGSQLTGIDTGVPTGTKMMFCQASAPTDWTQDTTHNNKGLRVVSGTGGGTGGTTDWTAPTGGNATLSTSQMPSHSHTYGISSGDYSAGNKWGRDRTSTNSNTGSTGGGGSHSHSVNVLKYVDVIICTKD